MMGKAKVFVHGKRGVWVFYTGIVWLVHWFCLPAEDSIFRVTKAETGDDLAKVFTMFLREYYVDCDMTSM